MSGFFFSIAAFCYFAISLISEYKLRGFNNLTIVACYGTVLAFGSFALRQATKTTDSSYDFPSGVDFWWMLGLSALFLIGDIFYFKAYNSGGTADQGMFIFALTPIMMAIVKYVFDNKAVTTIQFIGYGLLVVAVALIIFGKKTN